MRRRDQLRSYQHIDARSLKAPWEETRNLHVPPQKIPGRSPRYEAAPLFSVTLWNRHPAHREPRPVVFSCVSRGCVRHSQALRLQLFLRALDREWQALPADKLTDESPPAYLRGK